MRKAIITCVSGAWMFAAALWPANAAIAAGVLSKLPSTPASAATTPGAQELEELEEVLVDGRKPETDTRKIRSWLDRLVGEFRYEGYVEQRRGNGAEMDRAEVRGGSRCVRFGRAAAVQCQINVTWPDIRGPDGASMSGGVSSLTPAVAVYSMETRGNYIGYLQVDNDGMATGGKGWMLDDTLIARAPCADYPGKCERVLRLEAPPDGKVIRMRIDLEQDGQLQVRYNFQWIRLATVTASVAAEPVTAQLVGSHANATLPADVDSWLRRMVGQYRLTRARPCRRVPGVNDAAACPEIKAEVTQATSNGPVEAQCQGIGAGPGLRCVVEMAWPEAGIPASWGASMKSTPSFLLYGFDPVQRGIVDIAVLAAVDTVGPGTFFAGRLGDGELTSHLAFCTGPTCNDSVHTLIAPGGEWIQFVGTSVSPSEGLQPMAWKMYRMQAGSSSETVTAHRVPANPSPRSR